MEALVSWTLVTGSAQHLGSKIAHALAERGHNVVICDRSSLDEANSSITGQNIEVAGGLHL